MENNPPLSDAVRIIKQLPDAHRKLIISIIMLVASLLGSGDGEDILYGFQAAMQRYHDNCVRIWPKFIDRIAERGSIWKQWRQVMHVEPFGIAIAMTANWDVIHGLPLERLVKSFECTFDMCRMWFCKPPVASAEPVYSSTPATPRARRSGYQTTTKNFLTSSHQIRRRDGETCVVSGLQEPVDVCHIVPSSINGQKLATFKEFVGGFCPDLLPRVQQLFPGTDTDIAENLMCLTPTLHAFWGAGLFALEPVSSSSDFVTVRFWWMDDLLRQISVRLPRLSLSHRQFYYSHNGLEILTGDILKFRSHEDTPAPDFTLLKVQYLMQIMGVLCGAAEPDEDEQEEDDGDVDALQTQYGAQAMQDNN
ncbi:hypothetical protein HOO65_050103 [Ceratocystis lukuohia]|uniref:HNH nuclease domain-containing protein n=1 Tax=Ceratocystis lukuohia TaxID=2019550 RepID=A0ABR4MFG9_9PEZI